MEVPNLSLELIVVKVPDLSPVVAEMEILDPS